MLIKQKMNKINEIFGSTPKNGYTKSFLKNNNRDDCVKNNDKPIFFEPLLTYYESDDEKKVKENEIKWK